MTRRFSVLCLGLALVAQLWACARRDECHCPGERALAPALMVLLSTARSLHHQADIQLQQGQVAQAMGTVREILALKLDPKWPEAEEVRLDATARLAKLQLSQGQEAEALSTVAQGLAPPARESFYVSNLYSVRGEILEHRAKRLQQAGETEQARQAARQAMAAFERSIAINKRLQRRLLQQKGEGR